MVIPDSERCPQIGSAMAGGVRNSPHSAGNKSSPVAANLVQDPSFASAAVTATAPSATNVSEYAPATASESIVVGDHQGDAQSAASIQGDDDSVGSNNEGVDVADEDGDHGARVDQYNSWTIEGVEGLNDGEIRHMNAFYALLKKWFCGKEYSSAVLTKADYEARVNHLLLLKQGETDCCEAYKAGNINAYKWARKYHLFTFGVESAVLVLRPSGKKTGAVDVSAMALSTLQKPTYAERLFTDLWKIHKEDHCKGTTFYYRVRDTHGNVTREVCKLFTDVCPHCLVVFSSRKKPTAGIHPIITKGLGVRGQVDLIDFQSMPDGVFNYLLNYINHGVKRLTSIPLASKRASSVAFALFTIFTEIGPPSVLQTDNGGEFSNHAFDYVGRAMLLDDDFIDLIIKELKNLWPGCQMVRGSPRHSESNGGVERVNQTVQTKLGGWMKTNNSKHWAIGCKLMQWRINTQYHKTIKDTPYHLVYGQHPRVGISNLPVSKDVLNNLLTEAELNQVYSKFSAEPTGDVPQLPESFQEQVDAVADVATASALVSISPPQTKRKRSPPNINKDGRDVIRAKRDAMMEAVIPSTAQNNTTVPSCGGLKNTDEVYNRWLELIDERDGVVELEEIKRARVKAVFPIIYCINNKDITDNANFVPCILHKVRKEQYELLNANEDHKLDNDIDWGGDDGLSNLWSTYCKYPSKAFVESYRMEVQTTAEDTEALDESPTRHNLRNKAAENMTKLALATKSNILKKSPELVIKTGDVVLVPLDDVDRTKVDGGNLCGVVVSTNKQNSTCRVAVKQGLLHRAYVYHAVKPVPEASNNIDLHDLRDAYENYRSLPKLTEREAARIVSSVGGQGMIHCMCKGECKTNSCSCKKAGRLCGSRCHRNNNQCQNKTDAENVDHGK